MEINYQNADSSSVPRFKVGETSTRREIHDRYGGQRQGGISTPATVPAIFIFTADAGKEHGYGYDGWTDDSTFHYTGEGQPDKGDMEFARGNRAIRDHIEDDKRIFLFEQLSKRPETRGRVRFVAELAYKTHRILSRDSTGIPRKVIVFELDRIS